jgi:hypothetical protein
MTRLLPWSVAPVAWRGALVLAAGVALLAELAFPWEQPAGMAPPAFTGPAELRHPAPPSPTTYAAIAAHPLFDPSRAPWVAPPPPPQAAAHAAQPPPSDYILAGLVVSGGTSSAILKPANATKTVVITEGETLNGWTLRRIDAAGLHFEADGQTFDLAFPPARSGSR